MSTPELETYGLDCWGWYLEVEAFDVDDARRRAIEMASTDLEREMAEMANIKLLSECPVPQRGRNIKEIVCAPLEGSCPVSVAAANLDSAVAKPTPGA